MADPPRAVVLEIFRAALARVDGRAAVRHFLADRRAADRWAIVAIGKAAAAMTLGAADALGDSIARAFVVTKPGHAIGLEALQVGCEIHETSHPVPDESSVAAGRRLVAWIDALPRDQRPLVLVSGGASSLVELPREGVSLAAIRALNEQGLRSAVGIAVLNARRARLSSLKGGGLSRLLAGRRGLALFVSDVPGDDPAVIGSGLAGPIDGDDLERHVVAKLDHALDAAASRARSLGLQPTLVARHFDGEAVRVAADLIAQMRAAAQGLVIAGGESVVTLPAKPGRGGRNQHLALAAALELRGCPNTVLLAAGTDGTDGFTEDAGAIVDGETCMRIEVEGIDPAEALAAADSGTALELAGDLLHTGPTGTNVGDLVIGLRA